MYVRNNGDRRLPTEQPREPIQRSVHISSPRSRIPPLNYNGTVFYDTGNETAETGREKIEAAKTSKRETEGSEGMVYNPRYGSKISNNRRNLLTVDGDNAALFASGKLPFEEQIDRASKILESEDTMERDDDVLETNQSEQNEDIKNTPGSRPAIVSQSEYEESYGDRTSQDQPFVSDEKDCDSDRTYVKPNQSVTPKPVRRLFRMNGAVKRADVQQPRDKALPVNGMSEDMLLITLIILLMMSGSDEEMILILAILLLMH